MDHLYVCHFSNGHIKVGRSINPASRIASHADRVACLGVELVEHHIVECVGHAAPAEAALIERCADLASKRNKNEWFEGLGFSVACEIADNVATVDHCIRIPRHTVAFSSWLDAKPGRLTALAIRFKRSNSAVSQWRTNGVPINLMKAVRDFTDGEVTLDDMIPEPVASVEVS